MVDWSWDLLDEPERAVARRLSVFAGGATVEAAERVVRAVGEATLDVLTSLVEKSLLVAARATRAATGCWRRSGSTPRAVSPRPASGRPSEAAHAALFVELVETAEPASAPGRAAGVARPAARGARQHRPQRCGAPSRRATRRRRMRLVAASAWYWLIRGLFTEATDRLTEAGALDGPVPPPARALCTAYRAMAAAGDGDFTAASALLADAERFVTGLPADRHPVLLLMGPVAAGFGHGDPVPLERLLADPDADAWARAFALFTRAQMAENEGDLDHQRADMRAAHEMFAALGDRWGLGMTLSSLGDLEASPVSTTQRSAPSTRRSRSPSNSATTTTYHSSGPSGPGCSCVAARSLPVGRRCAGSSRCPACIPSRSGCCADTWRTRRVGQATSTTPAPNSPSRRPRVIRDRVPSSAAPCRPPSAARSPGPRVTARHRPSCSPKRWRPRPRAATGRSPPPSPRWPPPTSSPTTPRRPPPCSASAPLSAVRPTSATRRSAPRSPRCAPLSARPQRTPPSLTPARLARSDGVALLQDYARGAGSGSATAVSASATSRA